jgi:glycogen(starch) synthase
VVPLRVLVVARWFPAVDDPVRGSFVADQVAALSATGAVEPVVASFEFARLSRHAERQEPEREAVHDRFAAAVAGRPDATTRGGWTRVAGTWPSLANIPVARLPVASGPDDAPWREDDDHRAVLEPFTSSLAARWGAIDLVHAHAGFPDGAAARAVAERGGRPYVITEHASRIAELLGDPEVRRRYAAALRGAARVVTVSETLASELRREIPELAPAVSGRLVVIPNAVPLELFRPGDPSARRPAELLYVGTRKPEKGIATLLQAFGRVRAVRADATLRLIGRAPTGEDESRWRAMAGELGIGDALAFEPDTDRAGVAEAMRRAALFVHPSRRETFGVVAVEALASGLPVVATRSGGVDEILGSDPGAFGALVQVDDVEGLAASILEVLGRSATFDPAVLRASVEGRFAADAVARRLLHLYAEVLDEASGTLAGNGTSTGRGASAPRGTSAGSGTAGPDSSRPAAPVLIAGFNRVRAARLLAPLPGALLAHLTLVTSEVPGDQPLPDGIGRVLALDLNAGYVAALDDARRPRPQPVARVLLRRVRWATSGRPGTPPPDPDAPARVAAVNARQFELRLETAAEGIAAELERLVATTPVPAGHGPDSYVAEESARPDLVCLDGYDVVAAEAALERGLARLAPGAIRWLADRWAASVTPEAG